MAIMHHGRHLDFSRVGADSIGMDGIERLRYEVYCLECGFLDPAERPDGREHDEYDGSSIHLAGFSSEDEIIASLRLVRDSSLGFPLEAHSKDLYPEFQDLPRDRTAEISRLVVAKRYRRRSNDGRYGTEVGREAAMGVRTESHSSRPRSQYPLILFGLFGLMFEESIDTGLEYWLAAMEPSLARFLRSFGFVFTPIGPTIDYFGSVVPYSARIQDVLESVSARRSDVLGVLLGKDSPLPV
jgi:N-acyl amino acid synthase of PEP-CTERM/exosortase system